MLIETYRDDIVETYRNNRDNYKISYYFYNEMAELMGTNFIEFCNTETILINFDSYINELSSINFDFDFPDVTPGPLFYLDTKDPQQVFLYLETNLISTYRNRIMESFFTAMTTNEEL